MITKNAFFALLTANAQDISNGSTVFTTPRHTVGMNNPDKPNVYLSTHRTDEKARQAADKYTAWLAEWRAAQETAPRSEAVKLENVRASTLSIGLGCLESHVYPAGQAPQDAKYSVKVTPGSAPNTLQAMADRRNAPTVISAPGDYVTRDGTRVTIDRIDNGSAPYTFPCKGSAWKMYRGQLRQRGYNVWMRTGHLNAVGDHPLDIVGPWEGEDDADDENAAILASASDKAHGLIASAVFALMCVDHDRYPIARQAINQLEDTARLLTGEQEGGE